MSVGGLRWQNCRIIGGLVKRILAMEASLVGETLIPITGSGVEPALAKALEKNPPGYRIDGGGDGASEGSAK